jgi:hypothetical protein
MGRSALCVNGVCVGARARGVKRDRRRARLDEGGATGVVRVRLRK